LKNKKYHAIGTIPTSNNRIVERNKIDTTNTQIHNRSHSWLGTGTAIKSGGGKLIFWLFCLGLFVYLFPKTFKLCGVPNF
jgi:hypothetical protein